MVAVYAVKLNHKLDVKVFNDLLSIVSEDKRKTINKFHKFEDAQRSLVADVFTRLIIRNALNIENKNIIFKKNDYGKPLLMNYTDFQFNISHAGDWVVLATHNLTVGIDIEYIQSIDFEIARRFFSSQEYKSLKSKDDSCKLGYFFDIWTLKECYIKALGKGLSIPLNSFWFEINQNSIRVNSGIYPVNFYFKQYDIDPEYKLSVCACENNFINEVEIKDLKEICRESLSTL